MTDSRFYKLLVFTNGLVPLTLLVWDALYGQLGANPVEFFLRSTGVLTLLFLLFTLAISPLRKLFGWNSLIKLRRMVGLYAFFYGCLHLITYFVFDRALNLSGTIGDVVQRPFIAIGMMSFLLMVPLAVTSTTGMIKRLGGKGWQKLQWLVYVAAVGGVIHFWMIVKSDIFWPLLFGIMLFALLGFRLVSSRNLKHPIVRSQ